MSSHRTENKIVNLKKLREMRLSENTRQVAYGAIPLIFFGIISAQLFIAKESDYFARLGSLIVVWALLNLTISRDRYSRYLARIERNRVVRIINHHSRLRELMGDSIGLSFDLHASQIAQINRALGQENPFVENNIDAINKFGADVEKRMESAPWVDESKDMVFKFRISETDFQKDANTHNNWSRFIWLLEVILLLWGTIQWGYGDLLVDWFWS